MSPTRNGVTQSLSAVSLSPNPPWVIVLFSAGHGALRLDVYAVVIPYAIFSIVSQRYHVTEEGSPKCSNGFDTVNNKKRSMGGLIDVLKERLYPFVLTHDGTSICFSVSVPDSDKSTSIQS